MLLLLYLILSLVVYLQPERQQIELYNLIVGFLPIIFNILYNYWYITSCVSIYVSDAQSKSNDNKSSRLKISEKVIFK